MVDVVDFDDLLLVPLLVPLPVPVAPVASVPLLLRRRAPLCKDNLMLCYYLLRVSFLFCLFAAMPAFSSSLFLLARSRCCFCLLCASLFCNAACCFVNLGLEFAFLRLARSSCLAFSSACSWSSLFSVRSLSFCTRSNRCLSWNSLCCLACRCASSFLLLPCFSFFCCNCLKFFFNLESFSCLSFVER